MDFLDLALQPVVITEIDGLETRGVLRKVSPHFVYIEDIPGAGWVQIGRACIDRLEPAAEGADTNGR